VVAAGEPRIEFHFDISYYFLFFFAQACSVTEALNSGDTQQKDAGCMPVLRAPAAALSLPLLLVSREQRDSFTPLHCRREASRTSHWSQGDELVSE